MSEAITEGRFHCIEVRIYDDDGELIKATSSIVPGDYEYTEADNKYLDWLEGRRHGDGAAAVDEIIREQNEAER